MLSGAKHLSRKHARLFGRGNCSLRCDMMFFIRCRRSCGRRCPRDGGYYGASQNISDMDALESFEWAEEFMQVVKKSMRSRNKKRTDLLRGTQPA
jgi:hypothetical protein